MAVEVDVGVDVMEVEVEALDLVLLLTSCVGSISRFLARVISIVCHRRREGRWIKRDTRVVKEGSRVDF